MDTIKLRWSDGCKHAVEFETPITDREGVFESLLNDNLARCLALTRTGKRTGIAGEAMVTTPTIYLHIGDIAHPNHWWTVQSDILPRGFYPPIAFPYHAIRVAGTTRTERDADESFRLQMAAATWCHRYAGRVFRQCLIAQEESRRLAAFFNDFSHTLREITNTGEQNAKT